MVVITENFVPLIFQQFLYYIIITHDGNLAHDSGVWSFFLNVNAYQSRREKVKLMRPRTGAARIAPVNREAERCGIVLFLPVSGTSRMSTRNFGISCQGGVVDDEAGFTKARLLLSEDQR